MESNVSTPTLAFFASAENPFPQLRRVSLEDNIKYTLRAALLTKKGERRYFPELGGAIRDFLFRPLVPGVKSELIHEIRNTLEKSEPRIELRDIELDTDLLDKSRILVMLRYRVIATDKLDRLKIAVSP